MINNSKAVFKSIVLIRNMYRSQREFVCVLVRATKSEIKVFYKDLSFDMESKPSLNKKISEKRLPQNECFHHVCKVLSLVK